MDKYDRAIEWLVENPEFPPAADYQNIFHQAWSQSNSHYAGCLFRFVTPSGSIEWKGKEECGCLTMIRNTTEEIRNDTRIPIRYKDYEHLRGDELRRVLQVFAEWQRRLDREIRNIHDPEAPPVVEVVEPVEVQPAPVEVIRRGSWCGTANIIEFVPVVTSTENLREEVTV